MGTDKHTHTLTDAHDDPQCVCAPRINNSICTVIECVPRVKSSRNVIIFHACYTYYVSLASSPVSFRGEERSLVYTVYAHARNHDFENTSFMGVLCRAHFDFAVECVGTVVC